MTKFSAKLGTWCLAAACGLGSATVHAESDAATYPDKPVRMLVGFAAGGSVDNAARIISQKLGAAGWNVLVDNRTGASGMISLRELARSKPDGYTLTTGSVGNLVMAPAATSNPQVDVMKDLTPVAKIGGATLVLLVSADSSIHTLADLIAQAKKSPNGLNFASGGIATPPHLAGELLASSAHITLNHIPYRGEAPALVDLIGKQVPLMFANITTAMPQVKSGSVRAIAVTSLQRTPVAPSIPTMAEEGLPGFDVQNWYGIMAPAGTPAATISKIHAAVEKIIQQPDVQKSFAVQGLTIEPMSSKAFGQNIAAENQKWSKVIKDVGIKLN